MKYIKIYEFYKAEKTVEFLTDLFIKHFEQIVLPKLYNKQYFDTNIEYKMKPILNTHKEYTKDIIKYFKEYDLTITYVLNKRFYYNYQVDSHEEFGTYSDGKIDINLYKMFKTPLSKNESDVLIEKVKHTLSHELKHLYDEYIQKGGQYDIKKETTTDYFQKYSEIKARLSSFVNSKQDWDLPINDLINIAKEKYIIIDIQNEKIRKKVLKIIYQIINYKKKHKKLSDIIIKDFKQSTVRKRDVDSVISLLKENGINYKYEEKHRVLNITPDILKNIDINIETGDIIYPLIEVVVKLKEKNINIVFNKDASTTELADVIVETYPDIEVRIIKQREHWTLRGDMKYKYLISNKNTIPNWESLRIEKKVIDPEKVASDSNYDRFSLYDYNNLIRHLEYIGATKDKFKYDVIEYLINNSKFFVFYEKHLSDILDNINIKNIKYAIIKDSKKEYDNMICFNYENSRTFNSIKDNNRYEIVYI
jgi:hypothetical protein